MTIGQRIANLDPRYGLQLIMQSYASVDAKTDTGYVKKVIQEEILNVGVIVVGSGALAVETCCLVVDWMCKAGANCIGIIQYGSKAEWLARSKKYLSERTATGERIEKIVSRTLGVIGTFLGAVLVFWGRGNWIIQLHKDLKIDVHAVSSATSGVSGQEEEAPPAPPPRSDASGEEASAAASRQDAEDAGESHPKPDSSAPAAAISSAPPPPNLPPPIKAAAASAPKVQLDFKKEIERRGGQERKVFTMRGIKREETVEDQRHLTVRSGIQAGLQGKKKVMRFKSVNIEHKGTEGFRIKGRTKLKEIVEELGLVFEVPGDQMDDTFDSYIFALNGASPKVGEVLDVKYDHIENANFTIKVLEVVNGEVELTVVNYLQ